MWISVSPCFEADKNKVKNKKKLPLSRKLNMMPKSGNPRSASAGASSSR